MRDGIDSRNTMDSLDQQRSSHTTYKQLKSARALTAQPLAVLFLSQFSSVKLPWWGLMRCSDCQAQWTSCLLSCLGTPGSKREMDTIRKLLQLNPLRAPRPGNNKESVQSRRSTMTSGPEWVVCTMTMHKTEVQEVRDKEDLAGKDSQPE